MSAGSDDDDLTFFSVGKQVHVLEAREPSPLLDDPTSFGHIVLGWFRARCGFHTQFNPNIYEWTFPDERLCRRCVKATPADEQDRLFEHPQHDEDDDLW